MENSTGHVSNSPHGLSGEQGEGRRLLRGPGSGSRPWADESQSLSYRPVWKGERDSFEHQGRRIFQT